DGRDGRGDLHERGQQHDAAGPEDVIGVALGYAVVDDVGVKAREVQSGNRRDQLESNDGSEPMTIRTQVGAQQADEHGFSERQVEGGYTRADDCTTPSRRTETISS